MEVALTFSETLNRNNTTDYPIWGIKELIILPHSIQNQFQMDKNKTLKLYNKMRDILIILKTGVFIKPILTLKALMPHTHQSLEVGQLENGV